jgi:hypothetical protein
MGLPERVFSNEHIDKKGQHYIVHFSSRSFTDYTYTDAMDVHVLQTAVDPPELIYGKTSGSWGWSKTDHCQFMDYVGVVSPIRNATRDVLACKAFFDDDEIQTLGSKFGINVVPSANPDVVPARVVRDVEEVHALCIADCAPTPSDDEVKTQGFCKAPTPTQGLSACAAPALVHTVAWANPDISGVQYDSESVSGARPGDFIAFEWDDAYHDGTFCPVKSLPSDEPF